MAIEKQYKIILSGEDLQELTQYVNDYTLFAYDTETTGLNVRSDKVVGFSLTAVIGTGYYFPLYNWTGEELVKMPLYSEGLEILEMLKDKDLIMHNASYDVRITKNSLGVDLIGGLVADTVLMKHTVDEEPPFGLKDIAIKLQKLLKLDMSTEANIEQLEMRESIKRNGGKVSPKNMEIYKAELKYLGRYACSDTDLTLRIFDYYYKKLEDEGMLEFFFDVEVMPLCREVTIPMEENGIKLDIPKIKQYEYEISKDLVSLEADIQAELEPIAGEAISTLINKKCPISHKGRFAQKLAEKYSLNLPKTKAGKYSVTTKNLEAARTEENSEVVDYLLGNTSFSLSFGHELYQMQRELFLEITGQQYLINISSKQQLCQIFYDSLGEVPTNKTPTGNPQMNEDALKDLSTKYKSAELLLIYNKLNKIKSAYIDRLLREHENGYFYPTFKQFGTISGRYGSDLQQLPRPVDKEDEDKFHPLELKYRNVVREFFICKPGKLFIDADYESLEPHVFADDSGDDALLDVFRKGYDLYSTISIQADPLLEGKREQYSADKKADNYLKKHEPGIRQRGKAYTLGIRYGMKAFKLKHTLNVEIEEAEEIIENYFKAFPGLKKAMNKYLWSAKKYGKVQSTYGRIRHMPEARKIYAAFGEEILDPLKGRTLAKKRGMNESEIKQIRKRMQNYLNNALNFPIQSASASIVNRAAIAINRKFAEEGIDGLVIAQVHDQLLMEVKENQIDRAKEIVKECMENTTKLKYLELKAPPEVSKNFKEGH